MKTHFEHLLDVVPDLKERKILDLGSGRGAFIVECAKNKVSAEGLELNKDYIELSLKRAKEAGVSISVKEGVGERLPFPDSSFDFVNMCEVIEHVNSPKEVLREVYRVLKPGGKVYVSVPNRYGMKDQHFGLYFVNWLPRSMSDSFISFFGRHKDYNGQTGFQRLKEMHYFTYANAAGLFIQEGFIVYDIREIKIKRRFDGLTKSTIMIVYSILKYFYFDSFHFLLEKE
jgi:ubiquinone/menaquinone biosynthesis C-methylase UbiE